MSAGRPSSSASLTHLGRQINSTSGWVIFWQGCAVTWGLRKQHCVALSSCEAEIVALSEASKDMVYMRKFLNGLDTSYEPNPSSLSTNNMGARALSYNPEFHDKTKHIERRHFFVRDIPPSRSCLVAVWGIMYHLSSTESRTISACLVRHRSIFYNHIKALHHFVSHNCANGVHTHVTNQSAESHLTPDTSHDTHLRYVTVANASVRRLMSDDCSLVSAVTCVDSRLSRARVVCKYYKKTTHCRKQRRAAD